MGNLFICHGGENYTENQPRIIINNLKSIASGHIGSGGGWHNSETRLTIGLIDADRYLFIKTGTRITGDIKNAKITFSDGTVINLSNNMDTTITIPRGCQSFEIYQNWSKSGDSQYSEIEQLKIW